MAYLVNGVEYSTKKEATAALFEAAENGEAVLALAPEPEVEAAENEGLNAAQPHSGMVGGPAEGPGFVL